MPLPGVTLTGGVTYTDSRYGDDAGTILNSSAPNGVTDLS